MGKEVGNLVYIMTVIHVMDETQVNSYGCEEKHGCLLWGGKRNSGKRGNTQEAITLQNLWVPANKVLRLLGRKRPEKNQMHTCKATAQTIFMSFLYICMHVYRYRHEVRG